MNRFAKSASLVLSCCIAAMTFGAKVSQSVPKGWGEDFAAAKEEAKKSGKLLLLVFSGSDWCPYCMKMDEEVYSKRDFVEKAKKNYVLVFLDFPLKETRSKLVQKQNRELAKQFDIKGYPSNLVVSPSGKVIRRLGGYQRGGVDAFIDRLNEVAKKVAEEKGEAKDDEKDAADEAAEAAKDDRFFGDAAELRKVSAREFKQRRANMTNDFELVSFAGITFGSSKADGAPKLEEPYHHLSKVAGTTYRAGVLAGVTLAADPKEIRAMSADEFRRETCALVRAIEKDLGVRMAVTGTTMDFIGKKTSVQVKAGKGSGLLSVMLQKKK